MNVGKPNVLVAGAGIAGSLLARELAREGFSVALIDMTTTYRKACGDAVALREGLLGLLERLGVVVALVNTFEIRIHGDVVYEESFSKPKWAIVDKPGLVASLREEARAEEALFLRGMWKGQRGTVTVDARGPYANKPERRVFVYRVISKARWDPGKALLDFDLKSRGFYWIFPADDDGKTVNIGAGFETVDRVTYLKELVKNYSYKLLGTFEPLDERGAPVTVKGPIVTREGDILKVGEAAGLVVSTAGEGNRPAILSAMSLAKAIDSSYPNLVEIEERYRSGISRIAGEVLVSRKLLEVIEKAGPVRGEALMKSLPESFWRLYLDSAVTTRHVVLTMLRRPITGLRLIRSLLSSLA